MAGTLAVANGGRGGGPMTPMVRLAPLRDELVLHKGPRGRDGAPTWTLEDPARNRFFRIGWAEVEMLARWEKGDPAAIAGAVSAATPLDLTGEDVEEFARFLMQANLLQVRGAEANGRLYAQIQAMRMGPAKWLLKNYLFMRIPLVRPERFLNATMRYVEPLYSRNFLLLTLLVGLTGLFLVARQWDVFLNTFLHFFSLEGAALSGLALLTAKVLHELGHAYTAKRFGCRVPTMGVALMVMWPVLYTDTSAAWTLPDRTKRLAIGAAGMAAEVALACYMTLLWSFLPDGPVRSAAFLLATTTWILTLAVNLNPFMRFDGYFLTTDALDVANLQERSFRLGRWWLRERLFGFGEPKPEVFEPKMERILIGYALGTWVYRFFLFLGIALLVYHLFFKVLGIFLMIVELAWFIGMPIWNEMKEWAKRRDAYRLNLNTTLTLSGAVLLLGLGLFPWKGSVHAPALLRAENQAQIFVPTGAQLAEVMVQQGDRVEAGQPLFRFAAPDLAFELAQVERQIAVLRWQSNFHAMVNEITANRQVTWQELETAIAKRAGLRQDADRLSVAAPFAGRLVERVPELAPGAWMPQGEWLATLVSPDSAMVEAYVPEADLRRLAVGGEAVFYPEEAARPSLRLKVTDIAQTATRRLGSAKELSSTYGGGLAAVPDKDGMPVPEMAVYRVLLAPVEMNNAPDLAVRGTVALEGERQSLAVAAWRSFMAVLVRESGF